MDALTDPLSILRAAVAEETEAAKADGCALAALRLAEARYRQAKNHPAAAWESLTGAEQAHFAARRAYLTAVDRVATAEAKLQNDPRESACH